MFMRSIILISLRYVLLKFLRISYESLSLSSPLLVTLFVPFFVLTISSSWSRLLGLTLKDTLFSGSWQHSNFGLQENSKDSASFGLSLPLSDLSLLVWMRMALTIEMLSCWSKSSLQFASQSSDIYIDNSKPIVSKKSVFGIKNIRITNQN